jgi:hypothetical protein
LRFSNKWQRFLLTPFDERASSDAIGGSFDMRDINGVVPASHHAKTKPARIALVDCCTKHGFSFVKSARRRV